jgi:hypothetical protein
MKKIPSRWFKLFSVQSNRKPSQTKTSVFPLKHRFVLVDQHLHFDFEVRSQTTPIALFTFQNPVWHDDPVFFFSQLLLVSGTFAFTQKCVFKTAVAQGYAACDPNASQGTCCSDGETCLESGLCYGPSGIIYRGACLNEWSSSGCVT